MGECRSIALPPARRGTALDRPRWRWWRGMRVGTDIPIILRLACYPSAYLLTPPSGAARLPPPPQGEETKACAIERVVLGTPPLGLWSFNFASIDLSGRYGANALRIGFGVRGGSVLFWPYLDALPEREMRQDALSFFVMPDLIRHPGWRGLQVVGYYYRMPLSTPGLCPGVTIQGRGRVRIGRTGRAPPAVTPRVDTALPANRSAWLARPTPRVSSPRHWRPAWASDIVWAGDRPCSSGLSYRRESARG